MDLFTFRPCPVATGGDHQAFQSLERDVHEVDGFFMSRLEVTTLEWWAFVNDLNVFNRIDERGRAAPLTDYARKTLKKLKPDDDDEEKRMVQLIPLLRRTLLWERETKTSPWNPGPDYGADDLPVLCVSQLAAAEYAHWKTVSERAQGGHLRYRLPTDLEWERAARGVDRRTYVWGDYLVWSFCVSHRGMFWNRKRPKLGGIAPFDESVFGLRDMAGSNCEHTTGVPKEDYLYTSYRGGSWSNTEDVYFRLASRNGLLPHNHKAHFGVRLVAVPE